MLRNSARASVRTRRICPHSSVGLERFPPKEEVAGSSPAVDTKIMIDANHLYTLHHTYTGTGCAHCGKSAAEHSSEAWMVNGNKVEVPSATTVNCASNAE